MVILVIFIFTLIYKKKKGNRPGWKAGVPVMVQPGGVSTRASHTHSSDTGPRTMTGSIWPVTPS